MKKKAVFRGLLGIPLGIAAGHLITVVGSLLEGQGTYLPCAPELMAAMGGELAAVLWQTLLWGVLGGVFGACSVIWELERWSLAGQTGLYFLITAAAMLPIAYGLYWMEHTPAGFLRFAGVYALIFLLVWLIQSLLAVRSIARLNTALKGGLPMTKFVLKKILKWVLVILAVTILIFTIFYFAERRHDPAATLLAKPVIYLYPTEKTDVDVQVGVDLTTTYPAYQGGWSVTAHPDGTLVNHADGREYAYLFWEGVSDVAWDFSEGFCVPGEDTAAFLQDTLAQIGLTPKEYNEFIVYWLPLMEGNAYNLISFQEEIYDEGAKLTVSPAPDSVLRVFMAWQALDAPVDIEPQTFEPFAREGFTLVEWGGASSQAPYPSL